jgi:hypothetical protein
MNVQAKEQDIELALSISREARISPSSPYAGKYVGILDGKIVVVADSPEEGLRELRQMEPDPDRGVLIDTNVDHDVTHEIWSV